jgi:hypothetical protein
MGAARELTRGVEARAGGAGHSGWQRRGTLWQRGARGVAARGARAGGRWRARAGGKQERRGRETHGLGI